jgi:hypothetical protein
MKKMSTGTVNQYLNRETTKATADEKRRIRRIEGTATIIEFQK